MNYFVSPKWIKDNTPITDNVDDKSIIPTIKASADMWIRSYIGSYFYNDLLTKYNNQTLSTDEETLVANYIKYIISWKVCAELAIASAKLTNKGAQTESGDFSNAAEFKTISFISHHYSDKSDFYQNNLVTYMVENKDLYGAFLSDLNNDSIIKKNNCGGDLNTFNTNIIFI